MKKTTTLIKNADVVVTMNSKRSEMKSASILISNGEIVAVGYDLGPADNIINAQGCVVTPGLINTHHHLFQSLVLL